MSKYGGTLQTDIISVLLIQLRSDQPFFYRIRIKGMHSISCALSSLRMPQVLSFSPSKNLTNFSKISTNLPRTVPWIPIYNNLNKWKREYYPITGRAFSTTGQTPTCRVIRTKAKSLLKKPTLTVFSTFITKVKRNRDAKSVDSGELFVLL